jgi:competence ComEA-like helix-hairpin-helix protein
MSIRVAAPLAVIALGAILPVAAVLPIAARQPEARPEPPPEFTKLCVRCHPSDKIIEGRRFPEQWDQVIEQMVARGATGTEPEFDAVYDYLVEQYGRVAINTASADEIAQVLHLEPGVADTIVQQRKAGPIADFEALTKVPGVPVAELEKRRDAIVF